MIQTEGGFWLQLDIGDNTDFISRPEDLAEFTVIESCGGSLPEFVLIFVSADETILALLHEGTPIKATYGKDTTSLDTVLCFTGNLKTQKEGESFRGYTLSGLCVDQEYITAGALTVYPEASAIETVITVADNHFTVDSNIEASLDSQVWIQPSITDKQFVAKTLAHADLGTSFPACAITADGTFILRDMVALSRTKPKWNTDIQFLADGADEVDSTFINNWTGYAKVTKVLNLISDVISTVSTAFKPILSLSSVSEAMASISYRFKGFKAQSDAVHANYWAAADYNLVYQTQLSKVTAVHSFVDQYFDIKPLDLAFIKEYGRDSTTSSDYTSGLYVITGVSRSIQGKKLVNTISFNRESMNKIQNLGG
jgi:hypothetical protein